MEKTKTLLLLHGFKRNGIDDFKNIHEYLSKYEKDFNIINETYFDNYKKETLNVKYLNEQVNRIANSLKGQKEVIILGYSTGSVIASMVVNRLSSDVKTYIYAMVPPIKIVFAKWIPMGFEIRKKEKQLKKKLGKERYKYIKEKSQANKNLEKYPVYISLYINKLRKKYRNLLLKQENATYLLSEEDLYVHTKKIVKKLKKYNREYEVKKFTHDLLLSRDKDIFIKWFESKFAKLKITLN